MFLQSIVSVHYLLLLPSFLSSQGGHYDWCNQDGLATNTLSSSQKRAKNKAPVRKTPTRLQHATQRKPETLFLPCNSVEASKTSCRPVRCVTTCMLGFKCASVMPTKCYSILDHEPFLLCELVKLLYNDNLIILVHVATNFQI